MLIKWQNRRAVLCDCITVFNLTISRNMVIVELASWDSTSSFRWAEVVCPRYDYRQTWTCKFEFSEFMNLLYSYFMLIYSPLSETPSLILYLLPWFSCDTRYPAPCLEVSKLRTKQLNKLFGVWSTPFSGTISFLPADVPLITFNLI